MLKYKSIIIALAIFLLALAVRLPGLDVFFTADEFLWVERSREFLGGLLNPEFECLLPDQTETNAVPGRGLACTLRTGHPGVLTMWTGAAGITLDWLTNPGAGSQSLLAFVEQLPTNPVQRRTIAPVRLPTVIIASLFTAAVYLLLDVLFKPPLPLIAALLIALNPFHIALSRVLHHDALSTSFIITALLCLMIYFGVRRQRRWLLLAGALSGIAMLSKSTGYFLIPFAGLLALWSMLASWARGEDNFARLLGRTTFDGLIWAGAALGAFFVFWPAMWVVPAQALNTIYAIGFKYASGGHAKGVLFFNTVSKDPGPFFYPVMWFFRTNFWVMLGAAIALVAGARAWLKRGQSSAGKRLTAVSGQRSAVSGRRSAVSGRRSAVSSRRSAVGGLSWLDRLSPRGFDDKFGLLLWVSAFLLFFLIALTLGEKKQDRYALPLYPMLEIIAAGGLCYAARNLKKTLQFGLIGLILLTNLLVISRRSPYYFTYYNPLVGGAKAAAQVVTIGWGDGLNEAAAWLNQNPDASSLKVSSWYGSTFAPYFEGETIRYSDQKGNALAGDYIVFYVNQLQRHYPDDEIWRYFNQNYALEKTITLGGVDYAWIFSGRGIGHYVEDQTYKGIGSLLGWDWTGGVTPDDGAVIAGSALPLALFWEYLGKVPEETFFVRLIGLDGNIWAGTSTRPIAQFAGTSAWREGQIIEEAGALTIPAGTPPGDYALQIGLKTAAPGISGGELYFPTLNAPLDGPLQIISVSPSPFAQPEAGYPLFELELLPALSPAAPHPDGSFTAFDISEQAITFDLRWLAPQATDQDYQLAFALLDSRGAPRWGWDLGNLIPFLPTSQWQPGLPLRSKHRLPLDDPRTPGGNYQLQMLLVDNGGQSAAFDLGAVAIPGRERNFEIPPIGQPLNAILGQGIALLGVDIESPEGLSGQQLALTLYWQGMAPVDDDYTVFAQLLGSDGQVYAQYDSQPQGENAPTSTWTPGEIVADSYTLSLPDDLPAGMYRLIAGMYLFETGERLPVKQNGAERDFVLLWETRLH